MECLHSGIATSADSQWICIWLRLPGT